MNRLHILKDTIGYSASAVASQALALVTGLWIARLLGPSDFGIWNAVSLVLTYGAYVDLGVLSAMGRDLPFHLGRSDVKEADALESAARWTTIAGGVLGASLVIAVSVWPNAVLFWGSGRAFVSRQSPELFVGLRFMACVLVFQQVYAYHRIVLRSHNLIAELARQQFLFATITAALGLSSVIAFGIRGRFVAAVIAQMAILGYAVAKNSWRPLPAPSLRLVCTLMRVGLPITASGYVISLITTVDRPIVLAFLGSQRLGYLGLALLLMGTVSLVPSIASQVLYPRITFRFGQSGRDIAALRGFVLRPPVVLACLIPLVIGPPFFVLPILIRVFLPAYAPGLPAMLIVLIGTFFYAILGLTDYFLVTTNRLGTYAAFGASAVAFNIAGDYLILKLGYGIEGVAFVGTPLTYFVYSTLVIGYAASHYLSTVEEWLKYFVRLWVPFVYMVLLLWGLLTVGRFFVESATLTRACAVATAQMIVYLVGMLPLVAIAARELGVRLSSAGALWSGPPEDVPDTRE